MFVSRPSRKAFVTNCVLFHWQLLTQSSLCHRAGTLRRKRRSYHLYSISLHLTRYILRYVEKKVVIKLLGKNLNKKEFLQVAFFFFVCFLSQVNFLRQGCGSDKICQSNLKLSYQFGTKPLSSDFFTPLPK